MSWVICCSSSLRILFLLFSVEIGPAPRPFGLVSTVLLVTILLLAFVLNPRPRVLLAAKLTDSWMFLLLLSLGEVFVLTNLSASPPAPLFPLLFCVWDECLVSFFQAGFVGSLGALFSFLQIKKLKYLLFSFNIFNKWKNVINII